MNTYKKTGGGEVLLLPNRHPRREVHAGVSALAPFTLQFRNPSPSVVYSETSYQYRPAEPGETHEPRQ
jgi:hypothetical protein